MSSRLRSDKIMSCQTVEDLRNIDPDDYIYNYHRKNLAPLMAQEELEHIFRICGAVWRYSGDPSKPHAQLTGGECSNGYVNVLKVLHYTNLCAILAYELWQKFLGYYNNQLYLPKVEWVIGSDHAGATFSYKVAELLNAQHDFTRKGPNGTQTWGGFEIKPDEAILQVEELITTTKTLGAVHNGITKAHGYPLTFVPYILTLIHRSSSYDFEGRKILYLAHFDIETWDPEDCPLCKEGSQKLRPETNWAELTGKPA